MRRFNVALEGHRNHTGPELGDANISLEEEALMLDEADQAQAEVNQDLGDAERIVEVAESLEDLAVVAGDKEELTDHEQHLLEKAGDLAVAGSEVDPEEIVPAMESFKDANGKVSGKLAMESFRETANRLWETIKRIVKEAWAKIEAFFYKIFGTIPRQRKSLEALKARVQSTNAKTRKEAKFTVASNRYMRTGNTVIKTPEAYESAVKEFEATSKAVFLEYPNNLKTVGGIIADALDAFDPEKPAEATEKLAGALSKTAAMKLPGTSAHSGSRWPKHKVLKGHDLLGGDSLFVLQPETEKGGALEELELYRSVRVELYTSNEKTKDNSSSVEFGTIDQSRANDLIKLCEAILEHMESWQRGKMKGEIEETRKKIEKSTEKAETGAAKGRSSDEASEKAAVPHYNALIKFNVSFARWVQQPIVPFTKLAFGVINTTKVLIERSLSQYE